MKKTHKQTHVLKSAALWRRFLLFPWKLEQAQTLTVWRQAEKHHIPCVCFLNKMDKPAARWVTQLFNHIQLILKVELKTVFFFSQPEFFHREHKTEAESQPCPPAGRPLEKCHIIINLFSIFIHFRSCLLSHMIPGNLDSLWLHSGHHLSYGITWLRF